MNDPNEKIKEKNNMRKLLGIFAISVMLLMANEDKAVKKEDPTVKHNRHSVARMLSELNNMSVTDKEREAINIAIKGLRDGTYTFHECFDFWREIWMRLTLKPNPESNYEHIACQLSVEEVNGTMYAKYCNMGVLQDDRNPQNNGKPCTCGLYKSPLGDKLIRAKSKGLK